MPRHPLIMCITGMKGVGKTYRNVKQIESYVKNAGRKALIYNVNMEPDYNYPTIDVDPAIPKRSGMDEQEVKDYKSRQRIQYFSMLKSAEIRTIIPVKKNGVGMTGTEKKDVLMDIIQGYRNGLVVLEDIDKYATRSSDQELIDVLTTNRHSSTDVWIVHQSLAKITTTEWENITHIRMHHQLDDIERYKNRIPQYTIIRIAKNIVDWQFDKASEKYAMEKISMEDYDKYKSMCVYVDLQTNKINGCSKKAFIRACVKYLQQNPREVKKMAGEKTYEGKTKYSYQEAFFAKLNQLTRYYKP